MAEFVRINSQKVYKDRRPGFESNFKQLYRFERENVDWLSEHFIGIHNETRGGATSHQEKMKIFLRYVGDPGFQVGVGEDIGVHQSTVSRTVNCVAKLIKDKASHWIKFPSNYPEQQRAKHVWQSKYSFPSCIGALDCTHVEILQPRFHPEEYINRKGYASINIQATCDAMEYFTSVDCKWPGSVHDSRIWRNSSLEPLMRNSSNILLLGDEGYGITPWLMTPFKNPITHQEKAFNKLHTKERVIIERCFGQLKKRFPILQNCIRLHIENIPNIIVACFVLHNVGKHLRDDIDFEEPESRENVNNINDVEEPGALQIRSLGQIKRRELAEIILNFIS